MATLAVKNLQLAPLGAGDLIDRTVRLYRRHFGALIRASVPPVVVSAAGWVLMLVCLRAMSAAASEGRVVVYFLGVAAGLAVYVFGLLAQLTVMGGASRNLVMHLLWGEPVTTRLIYRSVRSRAWALVRASAAVLFWLFISGAAALAAGLIVWALALVVLGLLAATSPPVGVQWFALIFFLVTMAAAILLMLVVFFFVAGRVAYVPQVLMVEGRGVLDSISRSAALARGNVRRLMGMFLFTGFAWYSAGILLLLPLGWFAYLNGVNPFELDATRLPAWYTVGRAALGQVSTTLLAPVWMMGLSLLYVDERVRHEGYDIELLAAQVFGQMPAVPTGYHAPLAPAIAPPGQQQQRPDAPAPTHAPTAGPHAPEEQPQHAPAENQHSPAENPQGPSEKTPGSILGL
ncbi:MAG TPA: proline-rich domain-containing protein [Pyrinomonadaceae bacterium]